MESACPDPDESSEVRMVARCLFSQASRTPVAQAHEFLVATASPCQATAYVNAYSLPLPNVQVNKKATIHAVRKSCGSTEAAVQSQLACRRQCNA
jgi:hypothetical protein